MTEGKNDETPIYNETVEALKDDPGTDATLSDKVAEDAKPTEAPPTMKAVDEK